MVRILTPMPICKAGTLSGNTNDTELARIKKPTTAKSPGGSVGNAALAEERHGWSGAARARKDTPLGEPQ